MTAGSSSARSSTPSTPSTSTMATMERTPEDLARLPDGTVVTAAPDTMPYLIEHGQRRAIPNAATFYGMHLDPQAVREVRLEQLERVPMGAPLTLTGVASFDSGTVFLGSGHYMSTHGTLDASSGQVAAVTRIWTITMFGGFHGSVHLIMADQYDAPVWQSQDHRYGVDGTWIGTSDRTGAWWESMNPADTPRVTKIYIFQSWSPDDFMTILNKWVAAGQAVSQLITAAGSIAKVVVSVVS